MFKELGKNSYKVSDAPKSSLRSRAWNVAKDTLKEGLRVATVSAALAFPFIAGSFITGCSGRAVPSQADAGTLNRRDLIAFMVAGLDGSDPDNIYVMEGIGGKVTQITHNPLDTIVTGLTWCVLPNEEVYLIFASFPFGSLSNNSLTILKINTDDLSATNFYIINGNEEFPFVDTPQCSENGKVYYVSNSPIYTRIFSLDLKEQDIASTLIRVSPLLGRSYGPDRSGISLAADESELIFSDGYDIFKFTLLDGIINGDAIQLTFNTGTTSHPSLSPVSPVFVFIGNDIGVQNLYAASSVDGSKVTQLTNDYVTFARFSRPYGDYILVNTGYGSSDLGFIPVPFEGFGDVSNIPLPYDVFYPEMISLPAK